MTHSQWIQTTWIGIAALVINLPLGYLRAGSRKFSLKWFAYIHISVPFIAYLRTTNHVPPWAIPPIIVCALLGQLFGGLMHRFRRDGA